MYCIFSVSMGVPWENKGSGASYSAILLTSLSIKKNNLKSLFTILPYYYCCYSFFLYVYVGSDFLLVSFSFCMNDFTLFDNLLYVKKSYFHSMLFVIMLMTCHRNLFVSKLISLYIVSLILSKIIYDAKWGLTI